MRSSPRQVRARAQGLYETYWYIDLNVKMLESSFARRIKFLFIFLFVSLVMGYIAYESLVEAKIVEAVTMLGMWAFASFLVYGVYVGWIKTGASVVARGRYSTKTGHSPLTRDEEIMNQYGYFMRSTIESLVSDNKPDN